MDGGGTYGLARPRFARCPGQTSGRAWWIRASSAAQRDETRREWEWARRRESVETGRGGVVCGTGRRAASPAEATTADRPDPELQARLYRSFFATMMPEPWFAGAVVWEWRPDG